MKDNIYQNTLKRYILFFNEMMTSTLNLVKGQLRPDFCYQLSKDIYHMILKDESFEVILRYHNIKEYLEILFMTTCKSFFKVTFSLWVWALLHWVHSRKEFISSQV
jgi:hypothetical protein